MIENQQVTIARKIFLKFTAQCQIYPHILQYQSYDDFYKTRGDDSYEACNTFFDDIKKKFEIINLYELIDYARV